MTGRGQFPDEMLLDGLNNFETTLKNVESFLAPLFIKSSQQLTEELTSFERCKLNILLAFSINTLFYVYLRTQGIAPHKHPVKQELDRIRLYIKKIKELTDKEKAKQATLRLNTEAASRFIAHGLGTPLSQNTIPVEILRDSHSEQPNPSLPQTSTPENSTGTTLTPKLTTNTTKKRRNNTQQTPNKRLKSPTKP